MQTIDRIDLSTASALIDFSGKQKELEGLARQQLEGAVALHNMLASQGVAYLADEVGMGKTYIALGVVALMRRFKPDLRVLYLLPKNNVRDKWEKDYRNFVEYNYRLRDFAVKGLGGLPTARYAVSHGLPDLIQAIATQSASDHFICTSAFSFAIGNTKADLAASLKRFARLLPQNRNRTAELVAKLDMTSEGAALAALKKEVKQCWAQALHAIMPRFDLVIVDEAHNLKKSRNSSDRNQLLATLIGADDPKHCKAQRILLLSATPFDRDLDHLANQLALFGKRTQLKVTNKTPKELVHADLRHFMVRRLNEIDINATPHTRNMYRDEHRSGPEAEIVLRLEQQLFAAVLQKKVNESLEENCSGRFELGMLSSFESYLPGEKGKPIEFDGKDEPGRQESNGRDAPDRNIVQYLVQDYHKTFLAEPPHPKMDTVAAQAGKRAFESGKKQLIFVRRVRSVTELKARVDDAYDHWIGRYIQADAAVSYWFKRYCQLTPQQNAPLAEVATDPDLDAEADDSGPASPSSFFTWFYRGKNDELSACAKADVGRSSAGYLGLLPANFRTMLSADSMMFEQNWARLAGMPPPRGLNIDWNCGITQRDPKQTAQSRFRQLQFAYLKAVSNTADSPARHVAQRILAGAFAHYVPTVHFSAQLAPEEALLEPTLWNTLGASESLACLLPGTSATLFDDLAAADSRHAENCLKRWLIHQELVGVVCRLDHPFIDLYALRHARVKSTAASADQNLIHAFAGCLASQAQNDAKFSSLSILRDLAQNLDLLIKLNFANAYRETVGGMAKYMSGQLSPLSPVIGATGENSSNRSGMARKFRMPGYPCVLISTDVFQEGEDLHTFCDSVVHYGISASPIALEQKIGRVDRIASQSHRALRNARHDHADHFIQVGYPHIKQSLEFVQVRRASSNLNQFHHSLHTLATESQHYDSELTIAEQLRDDSPIPGQIRERLCSPFVVDGAQLAGASCVSRIAREHDAMNARLQHAKQRIEICLAQELACRLDLKESASGLTWRNAEGNLEVRLHSAQVGPELLLNVTCPASRELLVDPSLCAQKILVMLRELQADASVRYQLTPRKNGPPLLLRNVEVYAGGEDILADSEVRDALHRLLGTGDVPRTVAANREAKLAGRISSLCVDRGRVQISEPAPGFLDYFFAIEGRKQRVSWQVRDNYLLVTSSVISAAETIKLAEDVHYLIQSTLHRNALFDVVDFHVSDRDDLSVRALYPLAHLNQLELAFAFQIVAREADRLQHVLRSGADEEHDDDSSAMQNA